MAQERLGDLSYVALKRESSKGTFVIPNTFVDAYSANFETHANLDQAKPLVGNKFKVFKTYRGMRSHMGEIVLHGDPNSMARGMDMLYYKVSTTGGGPYTTSYSATSENDTNSYTVEVAKGQEVERWSGVMAHACADSYDKNIYKAKLSVSALKSFTVREVSAVALGVVTLKTNYDDKPTDGLIATDLIRFTAPDGTVRVNTTVTSVDANGTDFTPAATTGVQAGDLVFLRPQTVSDSSTVPFLWTRTEYHFDVDATTALAQTSAQQTRVEPGSSYTMLHDFLPNEGAQRSGAFDPANLVRGQSNVEVKTKLFFDNPDDANRFLTNQQRALVIRQFGETISGTAQELRITLNSIQIVENKRDVQPGNIIFADITFQPTYNSTDGQAFDVKVIHNIAGF